MRKKWTAQNSDKESVIKLREKKKWQIALRRYVLEKSPSPFYAPYFGLDIEHLREWLSSQHSVLINWESFSESWQLEHIIPVNYFDFGVDKDLKMCWNFTNIKIETLSEDRNKALGIDILGAKTYFQRLYEIGGHEICKDFIEKISEMENMAFNYTKKLHNFLENKASYIETLSGMNAYEYEQLNAGLSLEQIVSERTLLKRFT